MAERVGIVFTQKVRPYVPGERAFFEPDEARDYVVNRGVARYAKGHGPDTAAEGAEDPTTEDEGGGGVPETTYDLTVPEVRDVAERATEEELVRLLASEEDHPEYEGGRSTALAALREELEARAPTDEDPTTEDEGDEDEA